MKMMTALIEWFASSRRVKSLGTTTSEWLRGEEPASSIPAMTNPFQESSWVYAAVTAKASKTAHIPFKLCERGRNGGERLIDSGPVFELFQQPGFGLDRYSFWELFVLWLDLRGEVFVVALDQDGAVMSLNEKGQVHSLAILNPDHFTEVLSRNMLAGWRYSGDQLAGDARTISLLPEEVLHVRLPNPFHSVRGHSPLSVAMLAAQTDHSSSFFMKGLVMSNADMGIIVTSGPTLAVQQMEQIQAALRDRKNRPGRFNHPLFLTGGVQVQKPQISTADLQFLENRKFTRQEILAIFRVPETVLGFTEDANRSAAQSQMLNWTQNVISPLCRRLEAAVLPIIRKVAGSDAVHGYFDMDELPEMQSALQDRVNTALKLFGMGVPLNDLNRILDLGLPAYPWGDRNQSSTKNKTEPQASPPLT